MAKTAPNPFSFDAVIDTIVKKHGFDDYPEHPRPAGMHPDFEYPQYPAAYTYGNAPFQMELGKKDVPQDLIIANRKSVTDAINIFMPPEHIGRWMHDFFASDFMQSPRLVSTLQNMPFFKPDLYGKHLPESLTMQLNAPERMRTDRNMYTLAEKEIVLDVSKKMPAILIAVTAYSVAFQEYLTQLNNAIQRSGLNAEQKQRGYDITGTLKRNFDNSNFTQFLLPAIAIHYKKIMPLWGKRPQKRILPKPRSGRIPWAYSRITLKARQEKRGKWCVPHAGF